MSSYYTQTNAYSEYLQPKYFGWAASTTTINSFNMNTRKTISAQLIYSYNFPGTENESRINSFSNLSMGLKFLLFAKKIDFAVNMNNILKSDAIKATNTTQGILENFNQYYDTQFVRFSLSYKFGNKNLMLNKRAVGNQEEKNRAN